MSRLILLAAIATLGACSEAPAPQNNVAEVAESEIKGLQREGRGRPVPATELRDPEDEPASLTGLQVKPLLVNLWATWCAPCIKELPTLQALSRRPGAPQVIVVSQDMGERSKVDAFLEEKKLTELESWHDPKMDLSTALNAQVLPTTILYDSQGKEVWRYVGDLDWSGEQAAKLLAEAR